MASKRRELKIDWEEQEVWQLAFHLIHILRKLNSQRVYIYDINPRTIILLPEGAGTDPDPKISQDNEGVQIRLALDLPIPVPVQRKVISHFTPKYFMTFSEIQIDEKQ